MRWTMACNFCNVLVNQLNEAAQRGMPQWVIDNFDAALQRRCSSGRSMDKDGCLTNSRLRVRFPNGAPSSETGF
jgi:hypothetical protein